MAGEKVHLTGEKETLLITLYGKALESRLPDTLLKDHFADEAVRKIDYDVDYPDVTNSGASFTRLATTTISSLPR
ncbi:hypothetical protein [Mesorhizobium sp. M0488]|uniref:hypothetical protein n=1 Tax=unclassified Mesorhizobium TaxID=325217 RepID=UPI00333AB166